MASNIELSAILHAALAASGGSGLFTASRMNLVTDASILMNLEHVWIPKTPLFDQASSDHVLLTPPPYSNLHNTSHDLSGRFCTVRKATASLQLGARYPRLITLPSIRRYMFSILAANGRLRCQRCFHRCPLWHTLQFAPGCWNTHHNLDTFQSTPLLFVRELCMLHNTRHRSPDHI